MAGKKHFYTLESLICIGKTQENRKRRRELVEHYKKYNLQTVSYNFCTIFSNVFSCYIFGQKFCFFNNFIFKGIIYGSCKYKGDPAYANKLKNSLKPTLKEALSECDLGDVIICKY